jgi:hypothetical protein
MRGGRTAFFTIVVAQGLSGRAHRRAVRLGPRAVASIRPVEQLMDQAGYVDVALNDVTADFLDTIRAWARESLRREAELRVVVGDELDERKADWRDLTHGVEEGLLERVLVTARAPT